MLSHNFKQGVATCFGLYMAFAVMTPKNKPTAPAASAHMAPSEQLRVARANLTVAMASLREAERALGH